MIPELFTARFILACIFLLASISKFTSFSTLASDISEYRLLSKEQAQAVAYVLPFSELFIGLSCIIGYALTFAAGLMVFLLLVFTGAIAINLVRGQRFSCHCFGSSSSMIGPAMLVRNLILLILASWIFIRVPMTASFSQLSTLWQSDIQQLAHWTILIPLVGTIILLYSILFLLGEIDTYFYGGKFSIKVGD
jgi:uncharacterized membrane protein YphA (DoxX/SURF4 family)